MKITVDGPETRVIYRFEDQRAFERAAMAVAQGSFWEDPESVIRTVEDEAMKFARSVQEDRARHDMEAKEATHRWVVIHFGGDFRRALWFLQERVQIIERAEVAKSDQTQDLIED